MLLVNEVLGARMLTANEVCNVKGDNNLKRAKPKTKRSKSQKLAKLQKLSKSRKSKSEKLKKISKSDNSPNFNTMEAGSSFLTPDAKTTFNRLWLTFTKAPIL